MSSVHSTVPLSLSVTVCISHRRGEVKRSVLCDGLTPGLQRRCTYPLRTGLYSGVSTMLPFTPVTAELNRSDMNTARAFSFTPTSVNGAGPAAEVQGGTRSRLNAMESEYKNPNCSRAGEVTMDSSASAFTVDYGVLPAKLLYQVFEA
eukprot:974790-Prorocentrum_minimum.AAC.5